MIDFYYLVLVMPAFLIALIMQFRVKSTFNKFSKYATRGGLTGAQAARSILDANGLQHINIVPVRGELTDSYSHRENVIRLSDSTYNSTSIAAVGVAAHEAGHALQYANQYAPIKVRTAILPATQIGANLAWPAMLIGLFFSIPILIFAGIILFSLAVFFQLITLPVEYNASRRAITVLDQYGMMTSDELGGAKKVLSAAAMTYVAALAVSLANLLRIILLFGGGRRRR